MKRAVSAIVIAVLSALTMPLGTGRETARVPVVMYHSVSRLGACDYIVTPQNIERDFEFLSERGYKTVSVADLINYADGKCELPKRSVVLTFDDGFYNNLHFVLPLLEKFDFCATVNVVGSFTEGEKGLQKRSSVYSYLSEEEIGALKKSGRVEIGNHSYDMHRVGARKGAGRKRGESDADYKAKLVADAEKCAEIIGRATGQRPIVYAYPYGCRSDFSDSVLAECGYNALLTCEEGINEIAAGQNKPLKIKRYNRASKASSEKFFKKIGII